MSEGGERDDPGPIDAPLRALIDDQRHADAVARRRSEHSLLGQAAELGTLAGVLVDLAERRVPVVVTTTSGRSRGGVITSLGADFVGLRGPGNEWVLVALGAVSSIRPRPGARPTTGDRLVRSDAELADVLAGVAAERPEVALHAGSGDGHAGQLRAAGRDVITLVQPDGVVVYVSLAAVTDVVLR